MSQIPDITAVKPEPVDPVDLEDTILRLCRDNPKGITDNLLQAECPGISVDQRVKALQRLLSMGQLDLLRQGQTLVYKAKSTTAGPAAATATVGSASGTSSASLSSKTKGFEVEERLVYQIIEDSGNKGIWVRDIRFKSNLVQTQINKILKTLESKKLVKAIKSVQASRKKVYMLYDLQPDESVTGGAWYSEQDFDYDFVEVLSANCLKFLKQKAFKAQEIQDSDVMTRLNASYASAEEVHKFITQLGISKIELSVSNIDQILTTLTYDGKVEVTVQLTSAKDQAKLYRVASPFLATTGMVYTPCGICPVISQCRDGAAISPSTCKYLTNWLKF